MNKKKNITDATPSQKWNIYQYVLVIEKLLTSKDWETIFIETFWDLSDSKESIESKHHEKSITLWDKHEDLWKTIYNWLNWYDIFIKYHTLIFYTTARLSEKSSLLNWNTSTLKEKYKILNDIIDSWTVDWVLKYMNYFSSCEKEKVEKILQKVIISTENDNLNDKVENLLKSESIFSTVKNKDNRKKLFNDMMGIFLWFYKDKNEILKDDFFEILRPKLRTYQEYEFILENPKLDEIIDWDKYKDEKFISELNMIGIPENSRRSDIRDYVYAGNQVITLSKQTALYSEFGNFENILIDQLLTLKDKYSKEKDSFNVYFESKEQLNLIEADYFENNKYFQNWITHINVNDSNFTWLYE